MEKFWAAILIFVVVAAAGLMYVNQVYIPQKDSQAAMAETANLTLSAVRSEMGEDTSPSLVSASSVKYTVETYCSKAGNEVSITVKTEDEEKTYKEDTNNIEDQLKDVTCMFLKTPKRDEAGNLTSINFSYVPD